MNVWRNLLTIFSKRYFPLYPSNIQCLDAEWLWHRLEYQARGTVHGHAAARLKNDPGLVKLTAEAYAGVLAKEKQEANPDLQRVNGEEFARLEAIKIKGLECEKRVCDYADTLISAMNPRDTEEERAAHAGVPDPHPCGLNRS